MPSIAASAASSVAGPWNPAAVTPSPYVDCRDIQRSRSRCSQRSGRPYGASTTTTNLDACAPISRRRATLSGMSAPSVSSSITARLEVLARPTAVSELTTAIEREGGIVTALDVTASGHEHMTVDDLCG